MKRKNLFLSLISSLILTIALVTVTVVSLIPNKNNGTNGTPSDNVSDTGNAGTQPDVTINEDRDGSAEKPYVIYDAETFLNFVEGKYLDEAGNYIDYREDAETYAALNAGLYFELASNIDFAGVDVKPIFNKGVAFNGHIDGKGYALQNITLNVTKENLVDVYAADANGVKIANIGLFGALDAAEIKALTLANFNVTFEDGLYEHIWSGNAAICQNVSVGTLAGIAFDANLEVNVDAKIDAFAYAIYANNKATGSYALGGLVATASGTTIANSEIKVEIVADAGSAYYVGGVAGSAYNTTINNVKVDANVKTYASTAIKVAGLVGYAEAINIDTADVALNVNDIEDTRLDTNAVIQINGDKFPSIAGAVVRIALPAEDKISTIKNVNIMANADIDATFAGAVVDVNPAAAMVGKTAQYVELANIIVDANVKVLKAFGFAKYLVNTKIEMGAGKVALIDGAEVEYNIRLTGEATLNKNVLQGVVPVEVFMTLDRAANNNIVGGKAAVKVIVSNALTLSANNTIGFGNYTIV